MKFWGEDWILTVYQTLWDVVGLGGLVMLKAKDDQQMGKEIYGFQGGW